MRALFLRRPGDIRRVYVTEAALPHFKDLLKMCAERRVAYHVKTDADLDAVAETVHHDGVMVYARERGEADFDDVLDYVDGLADDARMAFVLLENVKNPHNLGAILRVCAHFGVPFCLRAGDTPELSPAAMRTAEGGAETTALVDVGDGFDALRALHERGFSILATSSHATIELGGGALPRRSVVLFGSEGDGLSERLMRVADDVVAIPGSGALESLNVACASSILLWELWKGSPPARAASSAVSSASMSMSKSTSMSPRASSASSASSAAPAPAPSRSRSSSPEARHGSPRSTVHDSSARADLSSDRPRDRGARPRRGNRV